MDATDVQAQVIIFTGLPGTGKSTLAEQVARTVRAPAFAADWLMGALSPALAKFDRSEYLVARSRLLETLIIRQLMLGQDAVVDALVSESQVAAWQDTAARFSARWYLIECICSDEVTHRQRIEGRVNAGPILTPLWCLGSTPGSVFTQHRQVASVAFRAGTKSDGILSSGCAASYPP